MKKEMTKTELANWLGVSKPYISKICNEFKVLTNNQGFILVEEFVKKINDNSDPSRESKIQNKLKDLVNNQEKIEEVVNPEPEEENDSELGQINFKVERALKEKVLRQIKEIELKKIKGEYISASRVFNQGFETGKLLKDRLDNLPTILAPQLTNIKDVNEIRSIIQKRCDELLKEIKEKIEKNNEQK